MLTISEVARFAGVTVRAVRHYHQRGLLSEPERDASGYRRYDADDVVTLLRIRTLATAGVPLARVGELLQASPEDFAQALGEVERNLDDRIQELQQHRRQVSQLADVESLALPSEVVDYLRRIREAGISERVIAMERDGWILLAAGDPDRVPEWIAQKTAYMDNPQYRDIYFGFAHALDWDPDDPGVVELADKMVASAAQLSSDERSDLLAPTGEVLGEDLTSLLELQGMAHVSRTWDRLQLLIRERLPE